MFFQEITSQKKGCRTQVYDQANLTLDASVDDQPDQETILNAADDTLDDFIEEMVHEGDSDALLIADYEQAIAETLQEDADLATAYSAYQQARHRLTERYKNGGFWPTRPFTGNWLWGLQVLRKREAIQSASSQSITAGTNHELIV